MWMLIQYFEAKENPLLAGWFWRTGRLGHSHRNESQQKNHQGADYGQDHGDMGHNRIYGI
jgi:hypothetical protein